MEDVVEDHGVSAVGLIIKKAAGLKLDVGRGLARLGRGDLLGIEVDAPKSAARMGSRQQVGEKSLAASVIKDEPGAVEEPK